MSVQPQYRRRPLVAQAKRLLGALGYEISKARPPYPRDFDPEDVELFERVAPYTVTTPAAVLALSRAVRYLVGNEIPGDVVECGVYRGGSMMAVAHTLGSLGVSDRDLYLFDTFEGMTPPTDEDVTYSGERAEDLLAREENAWAWCNEGSSLEDVRAVMMSTGYDESRMHFVKGKVEDTLPDAAPERIALLRLDTDWYESTKHELVHLFPRLVHGGVVIVDDYGWWRGSRQATDEYLRETKTPLLLNRIDWSGPHIGVKALV